VHCFLESGNHRVDLTEGNNNGKNKPLDEFLYTEKAAPMISGKDEYIIYRRVLKDDILKREEMNGIDLRRILYAREEALKLLKAKVA
jgi:predicted chitinase